MRGDKSWVAGIHETSKMTSIPGLPTQGSDVTILITRAHLHPLCVLVEFWGKFGQETTADYERLAKEIQSPENPFQEFEGNPGDQCLVRINDTWYRSRIVSRNGSKYCVFLIDKGRTHGTTTSNLAWGKKKHFHLPPEVEFCVLANVLPLSPENRWSPVALEFLKTLSGKTVKAHVQDVLVPHRLFLLHIPCISKEMYEMGIAKKLTPDAFQDFVLLSLQSSSGAEVPPETQLSKEPVERLHKKELFLYPELPAGTVETVVVTEVTNPQRIFCQLKVFSQELKKLSGQITQCCEGRTTNCIVGPEMIGFPCAARGSDGRWCRSVLQQVFLTNKLVEVLNVDYGTKEFVQVENVRPLAAEFFRMPVVTYVCSLHGIIDKGVGWTTSQIDYLKTLLLQKTVIAKFEYQSISEGVHYVTLYGDENTNVNNLFASKESSLPEFEKTLGDYAIPSTAYKCQHPAQLERNQKKMLTPGLPEEDKVGKGLVEKLQAEHLSLNSTHVAFVHHVSDPSEFWIQTQTYANELEELMEGIYNLYKDKVDEHVVRNPTVGLYCAAKAEDGEFYRATVAEVGETQIKVFFVDYGNTEVVDRSCIRTLPDKFKKLPCLSLKCTLAGVRPKDGRWNQNACEFFLKAVTDKELTVHVAAKYGEGYVVQLTDLEAQGERDLGTLMCSSGFAEKAETQRQPKVKMTMQPAILPQLPDARLSGSHRNNGVSFQTINAVGPASSERRVLAFKELMFSIGSVLDVSVSYIESPNDFWCQLVQNAGHLKLLMHDLQTHYAGSEFQPFVETVCVAQHPDNGMWYRALIIHKHKISDVDVLFVDYGQTETVSLYDLRKISPQFLDLRGQAFRCSLLNPVDPTFANNEWNEEATSMFHSFVETAASNFVILKCTIYAVMYSEQKIVFNVVDLETPFESVCTSMINLAKSAPPKKAPGPSFRLDTYYYSAHNVKTGTEEQVTVTCVNNVSQFYCQLERNTDVIKDLKIKVNNLCHQLQNVKLPTVFGTLCFAKYTDGQWYRGQIKATKPGILVHFVDYGDTIEVEKSDLLPVPREANDIMTVPVQAVVCSLSDVPAEVSSEVNSWFERSATECKFRALVVAREPDGKLLVELYHGNTQVNSKIKKVFQIKVLPEEEVVCQGWRALEASANHAQKTPKVVPKQTVEMEGHTQTIKKNVPAPKPARQIRDTDMNLKSPPKPLRYVCENGKKKVAPLELYRPPHQRQSFTRMTSHTENDSDMAGSYIQPRKESLPTDSDLAGAYIQPRKESPPTETKQLKSNSPGTELQKEINDEKFPKLVDLPSKSFTLDMEADVYVSHYNSPLSFYVQLVREEEEIISLVEKLNDPQYAPQTNSIKDLQPGDLVQAEFADDCSWYRAVIREIHSKSMALVEFVDFGNTAMMPIAKMGRLHKSFLQVPMYSTHCMMSESAGLGKEEVLDPEVVSAFKEDIGEDGEKMLKCHFIRQSGSVWEVSLEDSDGNVMCKVPTRCSTNGTEIALEKLGQMEEKSSHNSSLQNPCSLHYNQQEFLEGQTLEVYITNIDDAQTFWCQTVESEELDKMTSSVSQVGNSADQKRIDPVSLTPGSPCIALFSDDELWYRAEVIDKDGDVLSVLFVDYGNKSQVNITDVRNMPLELMETPPQAFLCELDGFGASHGSWDGGAVDELSALTTDKVVHLTVTRVAREEGKVKCLVLMECEGQVINEALKTWWKSSPTENKPSYETPLQCDSTVKETATTKDQVEIPESQEMDITDACIHQNTDKLIDPHILQDDKGIDEAILSLLSLNLDKSAVVTTKGTKEEDASVMDIVGPDGPLEVLHGEVKTCSIFSGLTEEKDSDMVTNERDNSLTKRSTVRMVPCEDFCSRKSFPLHETHTICEDLKQTETESVLPSCVLPVFEAPSEQEIDSGDVLDEEQPSTPAENDSITEGESCAFHKDTYSVLVAASDTAASESRTFTASAQDLGDGVEEVTCPAEEAIPSFEEVTSFVEEATASFEEVTSFVEEAAASFEEVTSFVEEAAASFEEVTGFVEEAAASFEEVTGFVEEATSFVEEETASFEEATASFEEATASFEEATASFEEATDSFEEATSFVEETTSFVEEATGFVEEATASFEEATASFEEATASFEESTDSFEEATSFVEETTSFVEEATASFEEATGFVEEATGFVEEATGFVEEATGFVEEATGFVEEATASFEETTASFEEATASFEESTDSFEEATSFVEESTASFEEATDSYEEATSFVEEATSFAEEATASFEEVTGFVEEATEVHLKDVCADPNEPSDCGNDTSERDDCVSAMTAEEMAPNETVFPCGELLQHITEASSQHEVGDFSLQDEPIQNKNNSVTEDETLTLPEDKLVAPEPKANTVPYPNLSDLVEEVTCLVGEICLTDTCRDARQEAEREDSEQLVHTPPCLKQDFSERVLEEEMSPADDSFEAQLSMVTHLSLIINDASADLMLVAQQSEE
ncbi:tudor domain-containing 6 isoform X2 [Centropristis striata]|uniref:tudor domain-containing 6 isoform X2 n=1 Tax=Centropristis striata TaxID=184440 RepID=UPI0027E2052B|nr:tudor domain-containing 6 isoform X2 [Centropristis striata]